MEKASKASKSTHPMIAFFAWLFKQPVIVRFAVVAVALLLPMLVFRKFVQNYGYFYYSADLVHIFGLLVLVYKLVAHKSCSGLSLKSQEFTAIFLLARFYASAVRDFNLHTVLTMAALFLTLWVIYMMRFRLNITYIEELDNTPRYYLLVPCAVLAIMIHDSSFRYTLMGFCWAFTIYLEAVSVLPQLLMMQKAQVVETFTAHYVFALAVSRLLGSVFLIEQVIITRGAVLLSKHDGTWWLRTTIFAEVIQTVILADFCYYYVKSAVQGDAVVRLPSNV